MADYTYNELMQMQSDAIRRVEEMQKRARTTAGLDSPREAKKSPTEGDKREAPRHIPMPEGYLKAQEKPKDVKSVGANQSVPSLRLSLGNSDIEIDSDRALILALILLLAEEQADELLLAGLVYMLG